MTYFKSNEVRVASNRTEIVTIYHDQPDFDEIGPFMSNQEIKKALEDYDNYSFCQLPTWLQQELRARRYVFKKRTPTPQEIEETDTESREERVYTHQETIDDLWSRYK